MNPLSPLLGCSPVKKSLLSWLFKNSLFDKLEVSIRDQTRSWIRQVCKELDVGFSFHRDAEHDMGKITLQDV